MQRKLRVCCLHGDRQDAALFQGKMGKLAHACKDVADFVFIEAPFVRCDPDVEFQLRTWAVTGGEHRFDDAVAHVVSRMGSDVDVLLGFSQGCSVIEGLLADQQRVSTLRGLIFGCAPAARQEKHLTDVPSLHIIGRRDTIVPPSDSLEFASYFRHPLIVEHEHGHSIPQLQALITPVREFLASLVLATEDAGSAAQIVADELEMIANVFGEDTVRKNDGGSVNKSRAPRTTIGGAVFSVSLDLMLDDALDAAGLRTKGDPPRMEFSLMASYPHCVPNVDLVCLPPALAIGPFRANTLLALDELCAGFVGTPMLMHMFVFARDAAIRRLTEMQESRLGSVGDAAAETAAEQWWRTCETDTVEARNAAIHSARTSAAEWGKSAKGSSSPPVHGLGGSRITVGLVGKPSAGKSTFFNAVTRALDTDAKRAKVGAFPFTTIEPNIGFGFLPIPCPCVLLAKARGSVPIPLCDCPSGHVMIGGDCYRRHPVIIKDVAGLVQGAYKGHGKGNQFLNDLCDADVLIHVVDGAASTDASGAACPVGEGTTVEDVTWVKDELHSWIFDNICAKWEVIARKPAKLLAMFSGYHARHSVVNEAVLRCGVSTPKEMALRVPSWTAAELHLLVEHFLQLRFPVVTALNKCDMDGAARVIARVRAAFPSELFVAMSAKRECDRLTALGASADPLVLVGGSAVSASNSSFSCSAGPIRGAALAVPTGVDGGVSEALLFAASAVHVSFLFPATGLAQAVRDGAFASLPRCLSVSTGSTVDDIFASMVSSGCFSDSKVKLVRFECISVPLDDTAATSGAGEGWRITVARRDEVPEGKILVVHPMTNRMMGSS
jgi:ribosome-binding ATPase YchF (GTP1/OBG family)